MSGMKRWYLNCDGDQLATGRADGAVTTDHGTVIREGCPWWHDVNADTLTAARRAAAADGWVVRMVGGRKLDLCAACDDRRQDGAA